MSKIWCTADTDWTVVTYYVRLYLGSV